MDAGKDLERRRTPWFGNAAKRAELRMRVWDLRRSGYSLRQVAEELGISRGFVSILENEEMDRIPAEAREVQRKFMEERLGAMMRTSVERFLATGDWNAFKGYQWTEERLARLLGLDAPVKVDTTATVTVQDGQDAELAEMLAEAKMEWSEEGIRDVTGD